MTDKKRTAMWLAKRWWFYSGLSIGQAIVYRCIEDRYKRIIQCLLIRQGRKYKGLVSKIKKQKDWWVKGFELLESKRKESKK
jgi:hypothetical protein